jgi:hypothetical protein
LETIKNVQPLILKKKRIKQKEANSYLFLLCELAGGSGDIGGGVIHGRHRFLKIKKNFITFWNGTIYHVRTRAFLPNYSDPTFQKKGKLSVSVFSFVHPDPVPDLGRTKRVPKKQKKVIHIVSHQWCDLFYRLLHSYRRHIEEVEGGERDILAVHKNEATVAWPEAIACHRPRRQWCYQGTPPPSHSTFPWTKISDFQEKRLKSMTASY